MHIVYVYIHVCVDSMQSTPLLKLPTSIRHLQSLDASGYFNSTPGAFNEGLVRKCLPV